jgi:mRNA interferase HicA
VFAEREGCAGLRERALPAGVEPALNPRSAQERAKVQPALLPALLDGRGPAGDPVVEGATFRKWLADRGCRFDHEHRQRGDGPVMVVVHHEGHTAEVPLGGSRQALDPILVRRVCEELGLDWSELPGPRGRS